MALLGKTDSSTPCGGTPRGTVASTPAVPGACLARILILSEDQNRARHLAKLLRGQGYATSASDFSVTARKLGRDEHPDLALIDAGDGEEKAIKLAHSLKTGETAHIPVIVMAEQAPPAFRRSALGAGVDDIVIGPFNETILLLRLKPLVRLGIMRTELEHRIATARSLGLKVDGKIAAPRSGEVSRILITGAANRDLEDVKKALDRDFDLVSEPDVFAAVPFCIGSPTTPLSSSSMAMGKMPFIFAARSATTPGFSIFQLCWSPIAAPSTAWKSRI